MTPNGVVFLSFFFSYGETLLSSYHELDIVLHFIAVQSGKRLTCELLMLTADSYMCDRYCL